MEQTPADLEKIVKGADGKANKETPLWLLNIVSALNTDMRYGRTSTVEMIFDRIFGKASLTIESEVNAQVTNNSVDLSALTTEELIQYNALLDKLNGNGKK